MRDFKRASWLNNFLRYPNEAIYVDPRLNNFIYLFILYTICYTINILLYTIDMADLKILIIGLLPSKKFLYSFLLMIVLLSAAFHKCERLCFFDMRKMILTNLMQATDLLNNLLIEWWNRWRKIHFSKKVSIIVEINIFDADTSANPNAF